MAGGILEVVGVAVLEFPEGTCMLAVREWADLGSWIGRRSGSASVSLVGGMVSLALVRLRFTLGSASLRLKTL